MLVSGMSVDSSRGDGAVATAVSSHRAGEWLVALDLHLHLKILLSILGRDKKNN